MSSIVCLVNFSELQLGYDLFSLNKFCDSVSLLGKCKKGIGVGSSGEGLGLCY
jgi:hypothetical protein